MDLERNTKVKIFNLFKKKIIEPEVPEPKKWHLTIMFKDPRVSDFRMTANTSVYPEDWLNLIDWYENLINPIYNLSFNTGNCLIKRNSIYLILTEYK